MFQKIEDIEVWKRGCRLTVDIYRITKQSPFDKDWGLRDQIRRAAISIPSNIAEGYERDSFAEFRRFLRIAKGSCGEIRTQLYIAQALGYLEKTVGEQTIEECIEISSMISSLISHLEKSRDKK